jgi:hypothetical protein
MSLVGFEVLSAVIMKSPICFHAGFFLGFNSEDRSDIFL